MLSLLRSLPVLALALAAADSVFTRLEFRYREPAIALYFQDVLLWLCLGILALVPAWIATKVVRCWRDGAAGPLVLLGFTVFPVLAHACLDAFTDLGGDLSALRTPKPWLAVGGALVALAFGLWVLHKVLLRVGLVRAAWTAAVLALAIGMSTAVQLRRDRSTGGALEQGQRPNLLLVVWDTTRAPSLSSYGYGRETTALFDRLAGESVVFEDARSASRFTLTSHLSMLTGVYPSHHGARMTRQTMDPSKTPSAAALLHEAGYRTGAFVGTAVLAARTGMIHGFETFDDLVDPPVCDTAAWSLVHDVQSVLASEFAGLRFNGLPHWIQDFQRPAGDVLDRAMGWIQEDDPRPWFCMINLYDAHWPYLPSEESLEKWVRPYGGPVDGYLFRSDRYQDGYKLNPDDDRHLLDLYDAELYELDRTMEQFLSRLDLDGDRIAVVLTSDHGEAFGEGGLYGHDDLLEPQLDVPLIIRLPGVGRAGAERVQAPVSGVDIAPTLLGLAGVAAPAHMIGTDLLKGPPPVERPLLVEDRDHLDQNDVRIALYASSWKLLRLGPSEEEAVYRLYDLSRDPVGLVDVSREHPDVVADLRQKLALLRSAWGSTDGEDEGGGELDEAALRALGYIGGPESEAEAESGTEN